MIMYKNKKILGVITARGGSKGIPRKNIKDLCGKPLIAYSVLAAKNSRYLTRCIVSSDDQKIIETAKQFGADAPFVRPNKLSQDQSGSLEVIQHALTWLQDNANEKYDYVMILQPTSPLRTAADIDEAVQKIVDSGADSVMSMVELPDFSLKKLKKIEDDVILPLVEDEGNSSIGRQELSKVYKRNCAIYLTKTETIMRGDLFGQVSRPLIMSREHSVDINEPADFDLAEFWMKKFKLV